MLGEELQDDRQVGPVCQLRSNAGARDLHGWAARRGKTKRGPRAGRNKLGRAQVNPAQDVVSPFFSFIFSFPFLSLFNF